ncbi:MAG: hypothetical protein ACFFAH_09960 [Promethearchaeota archaeon]
MNKFNKKNLIGYYYLLDECTKQQAREYKLNIIQKSQIEILFKFNLKISGYFGSVGTIWKGICILRDNQIILKANLKSDWSNTAIQEEMEDKAFNTSLTYIADIIQEGNNLKLKINLETRKIILSKTIKNAEIISYWATREIIKLHKLNVKECEEYPARFWRISNLIFKNHKAIEYKKNDALEVFCEYNLDLVKEEKRVVNNDELIRASHIDKAILNTKDYKIIEYEALE